MKSAFTVVAVVTLLPGLSTASHLGFLAFASLGYRERLEGNSPPVRFLVMIPAHNEEEVIAAALVSILTAMRPRDSVMVVADNCDDRTAVIAREHGAKVLERDKNPGRAEARQAGLDHAASLAWDAVVMIDADSKISPGFFDVCERALGEGAAALQTRSEAALGKRLIDQATVAAFALQGVTLPRGRDRLGLLVRLRGTGMVLRRDIALRYRFTAPASEDLFLSLDLCLDGVIPRHVDRARLRSENAPNWSAASKQRQRYEAGRMSAARRFLVPLLKARTAACFEAAWFLASPPFATAAFLLVVSALAAWAGSQGALIVVAALVLMVLAGALLVGLIQARAGLRTWLAILIAPGYLLWKALVQVRAIIGLRHGGEVYGPTPRS